MNILLTQDAATPPSKNTKPSRAERDRARYAAIKADPDKYAAYLKRKADEANDRRLRGVPCRNSALPTTEYASNKKRRWRAANKGKNRVLRDAHHAVELAVLRGDLVRPAACSECGAGGKIQGHHESYEPSRWLDVIWLCGACHRKRHKVATGVPRRTKY